MTTRHTNAGRTDGRLYPLEWAYGPPRDRPAWRRIAPDLSGGWRDVHEALGCDPEVTTSS